MIELYSSSSNLGDNLGYTALASVMPCRIHMYDDGSCRSVSPIFDGICEVVYDNQHGCSNDPSGILLPTTQRYLYAAGVFDRVAIPRIMLRESEIEKARIFVSAFNNPCIIKCATGKLNTRNPSVDLMLKIVSANPETTFLSFGLSNKHSKHDFLNVSVDGMKSFFDLPIREQAAIYHVVGKYIGPDTGDYHLMLAAGGCADVLVPPNSSEYPYYYFHYGPTCWLNTLPRVRYHNWNLPIGSFLTQLSD